MFPPLRPLLLTGSLLAGMLLGAPATATAATGWRCAAESLGGSVTGTAIRGTVVAGSSTEDCGPRSANQALSVPPTNPLLDVLALGASTDGDADHASAVGGAGDLRVRTLPTLPVPLPPVSVPAELTAVDLGVLKVDLTPAIEAARRLPTAELLRVGSALAYARGQCVDGAPELSSAISVSDVTVLGEPQPTAPLVDRALQVPLDSIKVSELDLTLATATNVLGQTVTLDPALRSQLSAVLALLPVQEVPVPSLPARVTLAPGARERTATSIDQRALLVYVELAGTPIVNLAVGRAAVATDGTSCRTAAPGEQPPGAEEQPDAVDLVLQCTRRKVVLIDVLRRRGRVKLLGAADKSLAGRRVKIVFDATGRIVARTRVRPDGSFKTRAGMPPSRLVGTNLARYRAVIGREESLNLKLTRRMVVSSVRTVGDRVRIRGRVVRPLASPPRTILVKRRVTCSKTRTVARIRPSSTGRFSVSVKAPANRSAAVYRLQTRVLNRPGTTKLYPTFTLPRAVDL